MSDTVSISINGKQTTVPSGSIVAAALISAGETYFRSSVSGSERGPICGMGICFECRVTIDGVFHARSCQTLCREGMEITTGG